MPQHLKDHLARGRHIPGIIFLTVALDIGEIVEGLMLVWGASLPREYEDSYVYLSQIIGKTVS
jgi:hypothetical protein